MTKIKYGLSMDKISGKIKVAGKWNIYLIVPAVIVLVALIAFMAFSLASGTASQGMNIGLDFTGGTALTVNMGTDLSDAEFDALSAKFTKIIEDKGFNVSAAQKTGSGLDTAIYIKYANPAKDDQLEELNTEISNEVVAAAGDYNLTVGDNVSIEAISASSASRLLRQAIIAIVVTWAVVLVYVIIRFELWSAITALIGLIFDVIVMVCLTIVTHVPVTQNFVAALITIVAYSINNTIVVFDRVREHVKGKSITLTSQNVGDEVDAAVRETAGRSIATTITTMITVVMLAILGVKSIAQEFCLPVLYGLLSGVFTSLFVAPSLYVAIRTSVFKRKEGGSNAYVGAVSAKPEGSNNAQKKAKANAKKKSQVRANVSHKYKRK
ncbi:MAG: protein translocase subunit SecF [Clostridia bacterium]|nr:protein translocase subunit SecF [Clostridia bacterium]